MADTAERFDRGAIREFCEVLTALSGVRPSVLSHPEDDPTSPLTVDALVDIGGEVWAIDHIRLVYERGLIPAVDDIADRMRSALEPLAIEHDQHFIVTYLPPGLTSTGDAKGRAGRQAREAERTAFIDTVVELATQAVTTGNDRNLRDGITSVRLALRPNPSGQRVDLWPWGSAGPWLEAQVAAGLADALRAKAEGQLAKAKEAGFQVMLLIDQVHDPTSRQPSFFLASAGTVAPLLELVRQEWPGVLDRVWFRDRHKMLHQLV